MNQKSRFILFSKNDLFANILSGFIRTFCLLLVSVTSSEPQAVGWCVEAISVNKSRCKEGFGSGGHLHTQSINLQITPASCPTMSFPSKGSCSFGFSSHPKHLKLLHSCSWDGKKKHFRHRVYIALLAKCQRDRLTCNGAFRRVETLDVLPDNKSNNRVWENLGLVPLPVSLFSMSPRNVFRPFTIMLTQSKLSWTTVRYETLSPA